MEFSYDVSLKDAREAFWLHYWNLRTKIAMVAFLALAVADLAIMFAIVKSDMAAGKRALESFGSDPTSSFLILLAVLLFFFGYVFLLLPWIALRPIRKNPSLLAVRQASATSEYFDVQAEGGSSRLKWSVYKYWREGKNVIILKVVSGQYQAVSKRALADAQREELRAILTAALPKK